MVVKFSIPFSTMQSVVILTNDAEKLKSVPR